MRDSSQVLPNAYSAPLACWSLVPRGGTGCGTTSPVIFTRPSYTDIETSLLLLLTSLHPLCHIYYFLPCGTSLETHALKTVFAATSSTGLPTEVIRMILTNGFCVRETRSNP